MFNSQFLDLGVPSTAHGHLRTSHTFKILWHQFKTQVAKSQVGLNDCLQRENPATHLSINAQ